MNNRAVSAPDLAALTTAPRKAEISIVAADVVGITARAEVEAIDKGVYCKVMESLARSKIQP